MTSLLRERHHLKADGSEDDFSVFTQASILSTLSSITQILTLFLGAIAGILLLVGGIGIMNIMLVSVTERAREIGLFFGIYPAQRAARRDPIEALRHE